MPNPKIRTVAGSESATPARPLRVIASEIAQDWPAGTKITNNFMGAGTHPAAPFIDAMRGLDKITDMYYYDTGVEVVSRFLANAGQWRGETARRVKAELRAMLAAAQGGRR